jgi:hypothetical protein
VWKSRTEPIRLVLDVGCRAEGLCHTPKEKKELTMTDSTVQMWRTGIASIAIVGISACASIRPVEQAAPSTRHVYEKTYEIGQEKTTYTGDQMIAYKDYYVTSSHANTVTPIEDFVMKYWDGHNGVFKKGNQYPIVGEATIDGVYYYAVSADFKSWVGLTGKYLIMVTKDGTVSKDVYTVANLKVGTFDIEPPSAKCRLSTEEAVDMSRGFTNIELVFTGFSNQSINLLYREYTSDDLARPAFYQNLTYDRHSEFLRFRKIRLKVDDVSAESITFSVVEDGLAEQ